MNKTILKSEAVIDKRIEALNKKIEETKEKWPEDMYGFRWQEKAEKYENEIQELEDYKQSKQKSSNDLNKAMAARKNMFHARLLMNEVVGALKTYGEDSLAKRLERELNATE